MIQQRIVVYGFILNPKGELLLIQRADHDSHPGMWEIPGGGLELGEQPAEGVKREVMEETGLEVEVKFPIFSLASQFFKIPSSQTIRIAYFCETNNYKVKLSKDHSGFRWVLPEKIDFPLSNFVENLLKSPYLRKLTAAS